MYLRVCVTRQETVGLMVSSVHNVYACFLVRFLRIHLLCLSRKTCSARSGCSRGAKEGQAVAGVICCLG